MIFNDLASQFKNLVDPSTALGAFLISISASIVCSFFGGFSTCKKRIQKQSAFFVGGDMSMNSKNRGDKK